MRPMGFITRSFKPAKFCQKSRREGKMAHSKLIPLSFDKIMQTPSYTVIILSSKEKRFAIYTDPSIGKTLQTYLTGTEKIRPMTHDLMDYVFQALGIKVKQVVINDIKETIYYARLFLEQDLGDVVQILEIDARPSDAITLALMSNTRVYCTEEVLAKTVPLKE